MFRRRARGGGSVPGGGGGVGGVGSLPNNAGGCFEGGRGGADRCRGGGGARWARHPAQQCRGDSRPGDQRGVRRGKVRRGVQPQRALGAGGDEGGLSTPEGGGWWVDHQYRVGGG